MQTLLARKKREFHRTPVWLHLPGLKSARTQRCDKEGITQDESGRLAGSVGIVFAKHQSPSKQKPGEINKDRAKRFQSLSKDSRTESAQALGYVV